LASLQREDVLSAKNNQLLLSALTNTIYNSRIPRAINYAVPVAHKTGTKDWVYNDAALILLPDNPFVLVVLTRHAPARVQTLMRNITQDLYRLHMQRRDSGEASQMQALHLWLRQHGDDNMGLQIFGRPNDPSETADKPRVPLEHLYSHHTSAAPLHQQDA
jgi:hypothetical protein